MSANTRPQFWVSPEPPIVQDELAHIGAGLRFAHNPTEFFRSLRAQYGDVFLVDVFGYKLFCVFSPAALKSLYAVAEEEASFGMATFDMLGFKTPLQVFLDADIDLFYELLLPEKVEAYLHDFAEVIRQVTEEWGESGELDVFDEIRTLEQRVGFRIWMGPEASEDGTWQPLKRHFDTLSQEVAFVDPQQTLETLTSGKAKEMEAISEITELVKEIVRSREQSGDWPEDNLTFLYRRFQDDDPGVTLRKLTHNLINANQGFLSNLYAALAWVLINLNRYPDCEDRLRGEIQATAHKHGAGFYTNPQALQEMRFCEQILMESVRTAQRSITLRKVMKELRFDCGDTEYTLQPGVYITTMLSVTNVDSQERARFDPDHYSGRKIRDDLVEQGRETVSTFGHGSHACPAQKFSHNMCKVLFSILLERFQFEQLDSPVAPAGAQMGGVARAEDPPRLGYRRHVRAIS